MFVSSEHVHTSPEQTQILLGALMGGGDPGMMGGGAAAAKPRAAMLGKPKDKRKQERDARRKNRKK